MLKVHLTVLCEAHGVLKEPLPLHLFAKLSQKKQHHSIFFAFINRNNIL
jgi:hypothetical protein